MKYVLGFIGWTIMMMLAIPSLANANETEDHLKNYSKYRNAVPTIYYIPFYNLDKNYYCGKERKVWIYNPNDRAPIAQLCSTHFQNCRMQGSCVLIKKGERLMVNYRSGVYFALLDQNVCPYGYGPKNTCLEPYYSVAADPAYHQIGEVLYMHELRGTELPNGETHNGFVIVRDTGGRIKGRDRFDLYTGFSEPNDPTNPFVQKGFQDQRAVLRYAKVISEEVRNKILTKRKFPGIAAEF